MVSICGRLPTTHFTLSRFPHQNRFFSSTTAYSSSSPSPSSPTSPSLLVNYLTDSCGLSHDRAVSISITYRKHVSAFNLHKANRVLKILMNHGFSDAQVRRLVSSLPTLLRCGDPENVVGRKLEFLYSIGFTEKDLPEFVTWNYLFLHRSLNNYSVPLYETMKSVLISDCKVVKSLKRGSPRFWSCGKRNLCANLGFLEEIGVPQSKVALLLERFPVDLIEEHSLFREVVNEVKEFGFDMSMSIFVAAINVMSHRFKGTRERVSVIYREWGWSDDDVLSAFKKHPPCLLLSEENLLRKLDFLMNKMGFRAKKIAKHPVVLKLSLEGRIIPRCSVIKLLLEKGLIKRDWNLDSVMLKTESDFLQRYVDKYQDIAPELSNVYSSSTSMPSETE